MGKYPPSRINDKYSDWHYQHLSGKCTLTDIDRIWVEVRDKRVICAVDIKEPLAKITETQKIVYDYLEKMGLPVYTVWTDFEFNWFRVQRWFDKKIISYTKEEYAKWIESL